MNSARPVSLVDHRRLLQGKLQVQRQLIAQKLGPTPGITGDYPRSMTMRFLIRRSSIVTRLLGEFATLLIGARFMRSMTAAMAVSSITQAAMANKCNQS